MQKNNKIIIWTKGIDDLLNERGIVGGITIQMYFWAKIFIENSWSVYSFSETRKTTIEEIRFLKFPTKRFIGIFIEIIYSFFFIALIKPRVIIIRGAGRSLSYLRIYSWMFNVKLIFFGASDVNFCPGKEQIKTERDRKLFRFGLHGISYFVAQNPYQKEQLQINYNKTNCIIIPNIWKSSSSQEASGLSSYILWVSNFRQLKRPEWFIELCKKYPEDKFIMVGGALDKALYTKCKDLADELVNIEFLGAMSFKEVNTLFASCRIFVCTSEIEGFPNTFLQAWANNKPIITTFDPGDIVKKKGLGIVVNTKVELENALKSFNNEKYYQHIQNEIFKYFNESHNAQNAFDILINFLDVRG